MSDDTAVTITDMYWTALDAAKDLAISVDLAEAQLPPAGAEPASLQRARRKVEVLEAMADFFRRILNDRDRRAVTERRRIG